MGVLGYRAAANRKSIRGFAALSPERRKEIAAMGGRKSRRGDAKQRFPKIANKIANEAKETN